MLSSNQKGGLIPLEAGLQKLVEHRFQMPLSIRLMSLCSLGRSLGLAL